MHWHLEPRISDAGDIPDCAEYHLHHDLLYGFGAGTDNEAGLQADRGSKESQNQGRKEQVNR